LKLSLNVLSLPQECVHTVDYIGESYTNYEQTFTDHLMTYTVQWGMLSSQRLKLQILADNEKQLWCD